MNSAITKQEKKVDKQQWVPSEMLLSDTCLQNACWEIAVFPGDKNKSSYRMKRKTCEACSQSLLNHHLTAGRKENPTSQFKSTTWT